MRVNGAAGFTMMLVELVHVGRLNKKILCRAGYFVLLLAPAPQYFEIFLVFPNPHVEKSYKMPVCHSRQRILKKRCMYHFMHATVRLPPPDDKCFSVDD